MFDLLGSLRGPLRAFSWIAARTPFYDDLITESLDAGIRQVLIIGPGYDARAWRLAREGVRFVEVDHPATQVRKTALAPSGGPTYVAADLSVQRLRDVLTSPVTTSEPMVLICEGLTYFLAEADVRSLLSEAAEVAPQGSRLGVDFGAPARDLPLRWRLPVAIGKLWQGWTREPIRFWLHPENAARLLAETGWSSAEVLTHADLHERFLRGTDIPSPPPIGSYACKAAK